MSQRQSLYKTTPAFPEPNYTQTPNNFFDMIPDMSDAELRVTIVMIRQTFGYHRDGFKMSVSKLATASGLSRQGALDGAKAAEERGTFCRANPDAQGEAEWKLVVGDPSSEFTPPLQPVEGSPQGGRGQLPIKENETKEICTALEKVCGGLNSTTADLVTTWQGIHPLNWILKAIEETKAKGARSANYTDKILIGWEANGYPKDRSELVQERKSTVMVRKPAPPPEDDGREMVTPEMLKRAREKVSA